MFYHIRIDYYDIKLKANQTLYEYDLTEMDVIKSDIVIPYLQEAPFLFKGVRLNTKNNEVRQLRIFQSGRTIKECKKIADSQIPRNVIMVYGQSDLLPHDGLVVECTNIVNEVQKQLNTSISPKLAKPIINEANQNKVFIVHGHDEAARLKVEGFLKTLGLEPIVLFKQPDEGNTIISKFEKYSDVGFAIVLYTYCDDGKDKNESDLKKRARQNVVFEHGYMIAKLGRSRVCALRKGEIEIPGDYQGVIFKTMDDGNGWQLELAKELNASGYNIDGKALLSL